MQKILTSDIVILSERDYYNFELSKIINSVIFISYLKKSLISNYFKEAFNIQ